MSDQWVALIRMTEIAVITQRVSTQTGDTFGSFAGRWIGLFMLNTLWWRFLLSRVLESRSGRNTGTKISIVMISKLILGYLFSTTASTLAGMEYWARHLAICAQVLSSLVNARNAYFAWSVIQIELPIVHESKHKLLWNTNAGRVWLQRSVLTCRWILDWNQGNIVGCVTESNSLLDWVQRRDRRGAEPLLWDVQSAKNPLAKSAGKRGTINMHKFT